MLATVALAAGASGCGQGGGGAIEDSGRTELVVFAASSLTEAFSEMADAFERAHPDVEVRSVFAGSQTLRLQLEQGATADVFASADEEHMTALRREGVIEGSRVFACNELVVVVPRDDEAAPRTFSELDRAVRIVVGAPSVPVGAYTRRMLDRAATVYGEEFTDRVRARIVSEETNVRLVRAKVELGEADAAIVYRTDAAASETVRAVSIPDEVGVHAAYPIGRVTASSRPAAADAFVAFVQAEAGASILEGHGFVAGCAVQ